MLPRCFDFLKEDNITSKKILIIAKKHPAFLKEICVIIQETQEARERFIAATFGLFDAFKCIQEKSDPIVIPAQLVGKILGHDVTILQCRSENEIQARVKGLFHIWNQKEKRLALPLGKNVAPAPEVELQGARKRRRTKTTAKS